MTVLLVGCGYWGKNWARTLHKLGALTAICEPSPTLQASLREEYPGLPLYDDLEIALAQTGIQAIVAATPAFTHADVGRAALLAEKHVLIEKPLTMDPLEGVELVNLAKTQERILAVGHLMLYHPALVKLKNLIDAGALGEVLSIQCTRVNLGKVRNEENVWWSLAPHDLSILGYLLNEPLRATAAFSINPLQRPSLEDGVFAKFESASDIPASVHVQWLSPVKKHETLVIGSEKIAVFDDAKPWSEKLVLLDYQLETEGDLVKNISGGKPYPVEITAGEDDLLTRQAQAFLDAVQTGRTGTLPNSGENGLQVVHLLNDVQRLIALSTPDTLPSVAGVR